MVDGRENWGDVPLRGEMLNVKDLGREKFDED